MKRKKEDYIKLKKVGISYSFKSFYRDYFNKEPNNDYLSESIDGTMIQDLKGWWWQIDEEISNKDFANTKQKIIKPIIIIVHGILFEESTKGLINKQGNVAYIHRDKFEDLF